MAWIRLSDDYNDHPKFTGLPDGSFRLWHQGMGYCRKYQTDGLIPIRDVRAFKSYSAKRMTDLITPWREGENPLWHEVTGFGIKVHDYLEWNQSKDEENERRAESKERMRTMRNERRFVRGVTPPVSTNNVLTNSERSHDVLGWDGISKKKEEMRTLVADSQAAETGAEAIYDVAREFAERYSQIHAEERHGTPYPVKQARDFQTFVLLARTWPDAKRLEDMFRVFLHLPGKNAINAQGTPGQFLHHAAECDSLLRQNGR